MRIGDVISLACFIVFLWWHTNAPWSVFAIIMLAGVAANGVQKWASYSRNDPKRTIERILSGKK